MASVEGFHHHGRTVSDMDRALAFYRDQLGFEVVDDATIDGMDEFLGLEADEEIRAVMLSLDGEPPFLELFQFLGDGSPRAEGRQGPRQIAATHPCLRVADIHELHERLAAEGVEFTRPPLEIDAGPFEGQWILYGFDPDGGVIEFWSIPEGD